MRLRTMQEAHKEILEADPKSSLTMTALRRMVLAGDVQSVRAGRKYLVDLDQLETSLFGAGTADTAGNVGVIRPVEVR